MALIDPGHPFFRPLWRRVLVVGLALGWALVEAATGSPGWAVMFGAAGIYAALALFGRPKDADRD
ncbi:hypothetical protein [Albidovulum sp.]